MEKEEFYQKIEAYLQDSLSPEQKSAFKKEIEANPSLARELELHQKLHEDLASDVQMLKTKLQQINIANQDSVPRKFTLKPMLRFLGPVTAIAAAIILGIIILPDYFKPSMSANQAYESYYQVYPMALNQRSDSGEEDDNKLNAAINAYNNEQYDEAAELFEQLYNEENDLTFRIYQAHALLAGDQASKALVIYNEILNSSADKFHEQASWYKGLALLETGDIPSAKETFSAFNPEHYKYKEAENILKRIKD